MSSVWEHASAKYTRATLLQTLPKPHKSHWNKFLIVIKYNNLFIYFFSVSAFSLSECHSLTLDSFPSFAYNSWWYRRRLTWRKEFRKCLGGVGVSLKSASRRGLHPLSHPFHPQSSIFAMKYLWKPKENSYTII